MRNISCAEAELVSVVAVLVGFSITGEVLMAVVIMAVAVSVIIAMIVDFVVVIVGCFEAVIVAMIVAVVNTCVIASRSRVHIIASTAFRDHPCDVTVRVGVFLIASQLTVII